MTKVCAIIQARMASSRLAGKVLLDIAGKPMLEWVVERTRRAEMVNEVVVATTLDSTDDNLHSFCLQKGYRVERGSVFDVLDRYYQIAKVMQSQVIVRITADCPLIDPGLINQAIKLLLPGMDTLSATAKEVKPCFEFVANRLPLPWGRSYPIGLDVEVFTFNILEQAWMAANQKHQREHVTPYFYESSPADHLKQKNPKDSFTSTITPEGFSIALMHHTPDYGHFRWTVDTPEDLNLVRAIAFELEDDDFGWVDILSLIKRKPELSQINANIPHKTHLDLDERAR